MVDGMGATGISRVVGAVVSSGGKAHCANCEGIAAPTIAISTRGFVNQRSTETMMPVASPAQLPT